jgi:hypothetical protein
VFVVVVVVSSQVLCLFSAVMKSLSEEGLCILLFCLFRRILFHGALLLHSRVSIK